MRKCVWFLTTLVKDTFILVLWYRIFMDVEIRGGGGGSHPLVAVIFLIFILPRKIAFFTLNWLRPPFFLTPHKMISWLDFWYIIAVLIKISLFIYIAWLSALLHFAHLVWIYDIPGANTFIEFIFNFSGNTSYCTVIYFCLDLRGHKASLDEGR